jgi:serine/threonine protein kinase
MADLDIQSYEPVEATSELLNRPDQMYLVGGQAAFLSLCVNQRIPIVNSTRNVSTMFTPTPFGQGASSTVLAFASDLSITPRRDFINPSLDGWFGPAGSSTNVSLRYVAKRVNAHSAATSDDPKSLAAITNEVRILSNSGIRSTPNIVSLLAVSWFEGPSHGRFWPQLYLERADLGTLENYLSSNSVSKLIKFMLYRNILAGLQCLHLNDVVSCDLKPQNILVFNSRHAGERGATEEEIQFMPVVAKLCDFGFAVILSDYRSKRPFQARIGTWPWMSPELDLSIPTQGDLLHKSDIYSSGLLLASIVENGKTPFRGMTVSQIRAAKRNISACDIILSEIRSGTNLTRTERARISIILVETLAPFPQQRVALKTLAAQWNVAIEEILQGESSSRRKNLRALFHSRYPTVLLISPMPIPALGNGPKLVVPNSQPEPGTAGWAHSGDDPRQEAVPIVPDVSISTQ